MSDEVQVLRHHLNEACVVVGPNRDQRCVDALAALDILERELIVNERAANDLFLENEGLWVRLARLESALREIEGLTKADHSGVCRWIARDALSPGEVPA